MSKLSFDSSGNIRNNGMTAASMAGVQPIDFDEAIRNYKPNLSAIDEYYGYNQNQDIVEPLEVTEQFTQDLKKQKQLTRDAELGIIRVDPVEYPNPVDRIKYFAANGKNFTNNEITMSMDHVNNIGLIVYPVLNFVDPHDYPGGIIRKSTFNVGIKENTDFVLYSDNFYLVNGKYYYLNIYNIRLAGKRINTTLGPTAPETAYLYSFYKNHPNDPDFANLSEPLNPITEDEVGARNAIEDIETDENTFVYLFKKYWWIFIILAVVIGIPLITIAVIYINKILRILF